MNAQSILGKQIGTDTPPAGDALLQHLLAQYGPLLDMKALTKVLRFPSVGALDQCIRRGHLGLPLRRFPHRRGLFALASDVHTYLLSLEQIEDQN
jgi:hypothetical protein